MPPHSSASQDRQGARSSAANEQSEPKCPTFDLERPAKKPRRIRNQANEDEMQDEAWDDDDERDQANEEEEEDEDLRCADRADEDDDDEDQPRSMPGSFGFGSDDEHDDKDDTDEYNHEWQTPKRTFRQTLGAKPKPTARRAAATPTTTSAAVPATASPELVNELRTHDSRIAGLEAGMGRLESLMASLMTQAQHQQQQLLQEIPRSPPPVGAVEDREGRKTIGRSLATVLRTTMREEYDIIHSALESPSQSLLDAWFDPSPPQEEARRLTDRCPDRDLPESAWPGAQAILAWSIARQANITVCTTTRTSLEYSFGPDDTQRVFLAYNGSHYRPYQLHTETERDYAASRQSERPKTTLRNKMLSTKLRKMETLSLAQNWSKNPEDGTCDE
eukprot:6470934-Amphidinium_carterae.1